VPKTGRQCEGDHTAAISPAQRLRRQPLCRCELAVYSLPALFVPGLATLLCSTGLQALVSRFMRLAIPFKGSLHARHRVYQSCTLDLRGTSESTQNAPDWVGSRRVIASLHNLPPLDFLFVSGFAGFPLVGELGQRTSRCARECLIDSLRLSHRCCVALAAFRVLRFHWWRLVTRLDSEEGSGSVHGGSGSDVGSKCWHTRRWLIELTASGRVGRFATSAVFRTTHLSVRSLVGTICRAQLGIREREVVREQATDRQQQEAGRGAVSEHGQVFLPGGSDPAFGLVGSPLAALSSLWRALVRQMVALDLSEMSLPVFQLSIYAALRFLGLARIDLGICHLIPSLASCGWLLP
jgi:hypothetical protein